MTYRIKIFYLFFLLFVFPFTNAEDQISLPINQRIENIYQELDQQGRFILPLNNDNKNTLLIDQKYRIESCDHYPYHNQQNARTGFITLRNDLKVGLNKGLQCLAGMSETGSLHSYHESQLLALLNLLESDQTKTFKCVEDEMYAYAVAKPPYDQLTQNKITQDIPYPGLVVDTYRISGFLSGKHEPAVYRNFFKLDDRQINEHLNGNPQKIKGMHQYKNRAGLLFHEVVHWLGHEHTNISPDVVFLYDTCCFDGSDFINDKNSNLQFKNRACSILKDQELWEANKYKQMRLWKHKGYNQLKREMREQYN